MIDGDWFLVGDHYAQEILKKRRADLETGVEPLIAKESLTAEQFAPLRFTDAARGEARECMTSDQ